MTWCTHTGVDEHGIYHGTDPRDGQPFTYQTDLHLPHCECDSRSMDDFVWSEISSSLFGRPSYIEIHVECGLPVLSHDRRRITSTRLRARIT